MGPWPRKARIGGFQYSDWYSGSSGGSGSGSGGRRSDSGPMFSIWSTNSFASSLRILTASSRASLAV